MDDLISRQAAIALAKDIIVPTKDGSAYKHRCIDPDEIRELPSVQPEKQCDSCRYRHIWMTQRMNGIDSFGHGGATG